MPRRDTRLLIEDMAAAIAKIQRYVVGLELIWQIVMSEIPNLKQALADLD